MIEFLISAMLFVEIRVTLVFPATYSFVQLDPTKAISGAASPAISTSVINGSARIALFGVQSINSATSNVAH